VAFALPIEARLSMSSFWARQRPVGLDFTAGLTAIYDWARGRKTGAGPLGATEPRAGLSTTSTSQYPIFALQSHGIEGK
jgi:hypothetical protein